MKTLDSKEMNSPETPQPSSIPSFEEIAEQIKRSAGNMGDQSPVIPDYMRGLPVQTGPLDPLFSTKDKKSEK